MYRLTFFIAAVLSSSSLLLIDSTIKGAAILLLAGCATVLLRRDSAGTRHLVWLVAVVALFVVPICSTLLPQWQVLPEWAVISAESHEQRGVPGASSSAAATPDLHAENQGASSSVVANSHAVPRRHMDRSAVAPAGVAEPNMFPKKQTDVVRELTQLTPSDNPVDVASEAPTSFRWKIAMSLVWVCGIGVLTLRLLAARLMLWGTERHGTVIAVSSPPDLAKVNDKSDAAPSSELAASFAMAVRQLEVSQTVSLIIHSEQLIPIVWGLRRFRLLLPETAREWTTEQQKSVLLHELAHIKRRDTWTQLLAQFACAVYWFNPLVWFAAWRLHVERERACDDLVLSNGVAASAYAEHLLNVATRLASSPWTQACGLAMARRSSLEGRLTAVLNGEQNRRRVTNALVVASLLIGGTIAVPVAMLRAAESVGQANDSSDRQVADDAPKQEQIPEDEDDVPRRKMELPDEAFATASKLLPKHKKAVILLQRWQRIEDRETPLKNSTVIRMRKAIDSWIRQPPVKPEANDVLALRDWELDRDEHPVADVIAWLDRIAAINSQPIQFAINGERRVSRELTAEERNVLKFGPVAENGLRAAWDYSPVRDIYKIGDVLKTTLVLQNTTARTIELKCPYSLRSVVRWNATREDGRKIEVSETGPRGSVPVVTFHVKPGEVAEIIGYGGVTIGDVEPLPLTRLKARAGERITVRWDVRQPVEMKTGPVSFKVAAVDGKPAELKRVASKLPAATEQILQWGKPVNGLRAALSRLPSLGEPLTGQVWDFNLVVQNVSEAPIRFVGDQTSPNIRRVTLRRDGETLFRLISPEPSNVDVILQPRETIAFPLITPDDAMGKSMAENPAFTFLSMMKVDQAPAGVWSGELRTPEVSGAVISGKQAFAQDGAAPDEPKPVAGEKLSNEFEQKLKWGKTVNGLRAAMLIRDTPEVLNEMFIVVQNVSQAPIHIDDSARQNTHTLVLRFDGILESVMSGNASTFGNVVLKPGEIVAAHAVPLKGKKIDGMTVGSVKAANLFHDPSMSYNAEIKFENVPAGTWKGTLTTANSTGLDAAPPGLKLGVKLDTAAEQKLLWGEPSNGLRAALAIRNSPSDPDTPDLFLAVQNVKDVPVRLNDLVAARGQRRLTIFRNDLMQSESRIDQPTMANVLLRPREVTFLLMAPKLVPDDTSMHSKGQLMASGMLKVPQMMLMGEMTIANARPGGWTGKLVTRITSGAAAKGDPIPKSKTAQALFRKWKANARLNGKIPGGQLRSLAKATSNFVGYNKEDKRAPQLAELLKRIDVTRDWTQQEAVDLLNDVTDVYDNLPTWANEIARFTISDVITIGKQLPDELKQAPWGEAHESGLRTAWLLDPVAQEYRLNTPLKSRILYQNNGTNTVVFRVVSWNQSGSHQAKDADGKKIATVSTNWTTIGQVKAVRLAPGEFTEVVGAGIGVGANIDGEVWRNTRVGTWIHAMAGDEVTFTPDAVTISGNDGRRQEVKDSEWWVTFITQRLKRDAPLPGENTERTRILERVVQDLFGTPPSEDEIETLLADKSPDALNSLAQRLAERKGTTSVYGQLQSGPTIFRVLPIDPEAKQRPFLAVGPGRYKFDNNATLVIVGRGNVMDAKLEFTGKDQPEPYSIRLSNGRGDWAIAWKRDLTTFWIADQGVLRSVDFSEPKQVLEKTIGPEGRLNGPKYFLEALRPTLKKNSPPAASPAASRTRQN